MSVLAGVHPGRVLLPVDCRSRTVTVDQEEHHGASGLVVVNDQSRGPWPLPVDAHAAAEAPPHTPAKRRNGTAIERPASEAVALFWRFMLTEFGVAPAVDIETE